MRLAELVLSSEGIDPKVCEISLSYVSSEEIRELNLKYRGKDEATDVLSFPMYSGIEEVKAAITAATLSGMPALIGDVVVCRDVAIKQAEEFGHSAEREEAYLLVHGVLHLLGYDHEEAAAKRVMRSKEEALLGALELGRGEIVK